MWKGKFTTNAGLACQMVDFGDFYCVECKQHLIDDVSFNLPDLESPSKREILCGSCLHQGIETADETDPRQLCPHCRQQCSAGCSHAKAAGDKEMGILGPNVKETRPIARTGSRTPPRRRKGEEGSS